jgi:hypothetical protein
MILRRGGRYIPRFLWRVSTRPRRLDVVRSWWAFWRVYSLLSRRHGKYLDVEPYEIDPNVASKILSAGRVYRARAGQYTAYVVVS